MGAKLATLLQDRVDAKRNGTSRDRVIEAALKDIDGMDRDAFDRLVDGDNTLPPADSLTALVEALEGSGTEALAAAREDGIVFEGDELDIRPVLDAFPLRLIEGADQGRTDATGDRLYEVVVIRPCEGDGPGSHIYEAPMLANNAGNFAGQPMFFNHEDMATILKRGHGSRDPRDLAGYLVESRWDASYTEPDDASNGYGKGAVVGTAKLREAAAELVDELPEAVKLSINMDPTRVRAGRRKDGRMGKLVEGVVAGSGAIDLITGKPGAGGKIKRRLDELHQRLHESAERRYSASHDDLADLDDAALVEAVRQRPGALERLREAAPPPEEQVVEFDADKLVEAMGTEDGQAALARVLTEGPGAEVVDRLVEAKVGEREDDIRAEAKAESRRELDLRDMRDEAVRLIESSKLPPLFCEDLRERYAIRDGHPSPALDLHDDVDGESGEVTKTKLDRLRESVTADVERERNKLAEAAPTRVRELRPVGDPPPEGEEGKDPEEPVDPVAGALGLDTKRVRELQGA